MIKMARNKLNDLNDHLFEQIERINDDDLTGEELDEAINKAKIISQLANRVIDNARVVLAAEKHKAEHYGTSAEILPPMLTTGVENE